MNNNVDRDHDKLNKTNLEKDKDKNNLDDNASVSNFSGERGKNPNRKDNPDAVENFDEEGELLEDEEATGDINDPLTDGRQFSREDDDLDGYKK
ncbi:hypothetical protein [Alkalibacterium kapii]|uniref:Uncharacterized protein n=1 Tax=Alkalibacterium kapii TaxID=426704 RepID=A0A511AR34_9LACT|nr:hypothetical protein [Alkalibacterium kapii]GEK90665.1 hypothetical protein AKA01nite_02870 [Alkalibacterium kapii]